MEPRRDSAYCLTAFLLILHTFKSPEALYNVQGETRAVGIRKSSECHKNSENVA
jgi:hypothetical protein